MSSLALPLDACALLWFAGALVFMARRRPPEPLWPSLPATTVFAVLWVIGDAGTRVDPSHPVFWSTVEYSGLIWVAPAMLLVSLRFAEAFGRPFPWGRSRWTLVPLAFAGAMWLAMATNRWYGGWLEPVAGQRSDFHFFWYANGVAMNLETIAILGLYVALRRRHRSWLVRRKAAIMIGASSVPLTVNSYYLFFSAVPPFDLGVASMLFGSALVMLGIYRTGLFNPLPVAIPEVLLDDPSGVVLADSKGYPFFANAAARELLPPEVWESRETVFSWMERVFRAVDGEPIGPLASQERLFRPIGVPERWIQIQQIPMRTRRGLELGSCIRMRDVTELHRALADLRSSEERFRALSEYSLDFIAEIDAQARVLYANPTHARILGIEPADLTSGRLTVPVDSADMRTLSEHIEKSMLTGDFPGGTMRIRGADGKPVYVEYSGRVFVTADGEQRLVISGRDVTARLRAAQQEREFAERLRETQKLESLGVLAGGIAHDFNNLLVPILANANLMRSEAKSSEDRESLAEIEDAALGAGELVRQLLAYAGASKRVLERLDLSSLARRISELLETAVSRRTEIRFDLADGLPAVVGDRGQLQQVVLNLVTNAADSLGEGAGTVWINTTRRTVDAADVARDRAGAAASLAAGQQPPEPGPYVVLEVRDDGVGIESEQLDKIFEPFFTTKQTGRGLGLAALRGIVLSHRGLLQVETEPGHGSVFRVLLPAADGGACCEEEAAPRSAVWKSQGRVLVVDDDPAVLRASSRMLERMGFEVLRARDGDEAISLFSASAESVRAVLLDLTMPHTSGDVVMAELRRIRADVPVIVVSGYSHDEVFQSIDLDEVAGFIHKPFSLRDLGDQLRRTLGD